MTLLEIVQKFTARRGLPFAGAVFSSLDEQLLQIAGLLDEVLEDMVSRPTWTGLIREATFAATGAEDQGVLATLAPGFKYILPETLFDRTTRLPLLGPVAPSTWQLEKAASQTHPLTEYRIRDGRLFLLPAPTAGHTIAFEYASNFPVLSSAGAAKPYFTADTDTCVLDEATLMAGLTWVWRKEKGMSYAEDFRRYESLLVNAAGRDGTKPTLSMDAEVGTRRPGVVVPQSDWSL